MSIGPDQQPLLGPTIASPPESRVLTILIVDDDEVSRMIIERAVKQLGHECLLAEDGDQAWEIFQESSVEVIISDWVMPGLDGLELCQRVREQAGSGYTYFIILSALGAAEHALEGMLAGADDYLTKPLDKKQLVMRLVVAERVTSLYQQLGEQQSELAHLNERLYEESRRDPLTRLGNRLRLREDLEQLDAQSNRYGRTYSFIIFDIDHFKAYNDNCGHQKGDEVLEAVAASLAETSRVGDSVYRIGGEELLVVLPEQKLEQAKLVAERMRLAVEKLAIHHPKSSPLGCVTISGGVATLGSLDSDGLLKRADAALYEAKHLGRNRVEVDSTD